MTREQKDQPGNTAKVCHCALLQHLEPTLQALTPQPSSKSIQLQTQEDINTCSGGSGTSAQPQGPPQHWMLMNPAGRGSLAGLFAGFRAGTAGSTGSRKSRLTSKSWNTLLCNTHLHGTGQVTNTPTTPLLSRHNTCLVI